MSRTSFRLNLHSMVYLNVKELLARSRRHIWSLRDSNGIQTHNHLVRKRTLNHLPKLAFWFSIRLQTNWLWVRIRPVWLNGWVFVYKLSGCGFESRCCYLNHILLYCHPYLFIFQSTWRKIVSKNNNNQPDCLKLNFHNKTYFVFLKD